MMIIEKSLSPNIDESQRILAGPLIADLVQKVTQFEFFLIIGKWRNPTSFIYPIKRGYLTTLFCNQTGIHSGTRFSNPTEIVPYSCLRYSPRSESTRWHPFILLQHPSFDPWRPTIRLTSPTPNMDWNLWGINWIQSNSSFCRRIVPCIRMSTW